MEWKNKTTVQKGTIGEQIVRQYLMELGFVSYAPEIEGAHPFDKLVASKDKTTIMIAECKTKARRDYYPDTGIDLRHYNDYKAVSYNHNLRVFIFFVDEKLKSVYGNYLDELEMPCRIEIRPGKTIDYPLIEKYTSTSIIYFPIKAMKTIGSLSDEQAQVLTALSSRNPAYKANLPPVSEGSVTQ